MEFMLRDFDISVLEKRLMANFHTIISPFIADDSIYAPLWCPLGSDKSKRMRNKHVLLVGNERDAHQYLEWATEALKTAPLTMLTIVVRSSPKTEETFDGWRLAAEWKGHNVVQRRADGSTRHQRLKGWLRAWHAWPFPPETQAPYGFAMTAAAERNYAALFALPKYTGLNLCFAGKISKCLAEILFDTGATDNFISEKFCRLNGIAFRGHDPIPLALADNSSKAAVVGEARVSVKIQGWRSFVRFKVTDLNEVFSAVIGVPTQKQWGVNINMREDTISLHGKKNKHTLLARPRGAAMMRKLQGAKTHPDPAPKQGKLMTIRQIDRVLRKGQTVFIGTLREAQDIPSSSNVRLDPEADPEDEGSGPSTFSEAPAVIRDVLLEFQDVFEAPPPGLPPDRDVGHTIPLEPGHAPPWRPLYRLSPNEKAEAERQVKEYLEKGWIVPSKSPFGAPILFVKKKDGSLRMCIDYRALNKITVKNRYPLPRIDDLLDKLQGSKFFSSLDLSQGYHQIKITDEDVPKTAFNTHIGHFEFRVLSFGLTNAPATFQTVMNGIFGGLRYCLVYLDDILIFSNSEKEHREHLRAVLQLVREHRLYCKLSKCAFLQKEVEYLGHIVSHEGIKVNPKKIEAVNAFPRPQTVSELRSFLGLANYFRKFIENYARIASPLTKQTGKNVHVDWTPECEAAFRALKHKLCNAPVLALPDPDKTFVIESDASIEGLGAVLLQDGRPVAYESRKLSSAERNYTTTEQELLAVFHALTVWRCYLEGAKYPFLVRTDHNALTYLPTQPNLSRRMARWSEYLQRFHFQWEYKPGTTNSVADGLSRVPIVPVNAPELFLIMTARARPQVRKNAKKEQRKLEEDNFDVLTPWRQQIRTGYFLDPFFAPNSKQVEKWKLNWVAGFCFKDNRVAVPNVNNLRQQIFEAFHSPSMAGHFGAEKTSHAISQYYWWPNSTVDIRDWCTACPHCQTNKPLSGKPGGLLQPLPIPKGAWDSVSVDFITGLPETARGYDSIMVVVDRLTKMAHFMPTTSRATALDVADLFYRNVWCKHGLSLDIVSDRDPKFCSDVWKRLTELWPMSESMSTGFHPQTDGQTERMNRTLQQMLRNYVAPDQSDWDLYLAPAEFAYNNAKQSSTGFTPFLLNYGRHPRTPAAVIFRPRGGAASSVPAAEDFVELMDNLRKRATEAITSAQSSQKAYADGKRKLVTFSVGEKVLLSTQNLKLKDAGSRKLLPRYIGPFEITHDLGKCAYRLKLPSKLKCHPVFHVSLLRKWRASGNYQPPPWELIQEDGGSVVERILAHREVTRLTRTVREYLIQWSGAPAENATWILESRVPPSMVHEYWLSKDPSTNDGPGVEPPLPVALRRSRRILGLDVNDSSTGQGPEPLADGSDRPDAVLAALLCLSVRHFRPLT